MRWKSRFQSGFVAAFLLCFATSAYGGTFQVVFEDFALSDEGNRVSNQESRCLDPNAEEESALGLADPNGSQLLLVCNRCRSGVFTLGKDGKPSGFFAFVPAVLTECRKRMEEIRENLVNLKATTITTEKERITGIRASEDVTPEMLANLDPKSRFFSRQNFEIVARVLESNQKRSLPPEENARFLVMIGLYRQSLETRLAGCVPGAPCKDDLFQDARAYKTWIEKNRTLVDGLSSQADLRSFNTDDFYPSIVPDGRGYSAVGDLERIASQNMLAQYYSHVVPEFPAQRVQLEAKGKREAEERVAHADPIVRTQKAKDVFQACRDIRLQTFEEGQQTSADLVERLDELGLDRESANYPKIFNIYERLGIISPTEKTRRIKESCAELIQTSHPKVEAARAPIIEIRAHASDVAAELEERIKVVNGTCAEVKSVVDALRSEADAAVELKRKQHANEVQAEISSEHEDYLSRIPVGTDAIETYAWNQRNQTAEFRADFANSTPPPVFETELKLYLNGEGKYADGSTYFPVEYAKVAFLALFDDIPTEGGGVLRSPMSTLSASKQFRTRTAFDSLNPDFLFQCMQKGGGLIEKARILKQQTMAGGFTPQYSQEFTVAEHFVDSAVIRASVDELIRAIDVAETGMDRDLKTCAEGPDEIPVYQQTIPAGQFDVLWEEQRKQLVAADAAANDKRMKIIGRYVVSSPGLVMNYIVGGDDDPVNLSVLCDALWSHHKRLEEVKGLHNANDWGTTALIIGSILPAIFGPEVAFVMGVSAVWVAMSDSVLSVKEIVRVNREKLLTQMETLTGGDPLYADVLRQYQASMLTNEAYNLGWNAVTVLIGFRASQKIFKDIVAKGIYENGTVFTDGKIKTNPRSVEEPFTKKSFPLQIERAKVLSRVEEQMLAQSTKTARNIINGINKRLRINLLPPAVEKGLVNILQARNSTRIWFRKIGDCMKQASKIRAMTATNLLNVKEIQEHGHARLEFIFRNNGKAYRVHQTVYQEELRALKARYGQDVSRWLDASNANRMPFKQWKEGSLLTGRYPTWMPEKELQAEYNRLQYSGNQEALQRIPVPKPHRTRGLQQTNELDELDDFWVPDVWKAGRNIPVPPKIVGERRKYIDNAMLAFLTDFVIRNASTLKKYDDKRGDQTFSWWAVGPDIGATSFKAFVPFIGIRSWGNTTSEMKFGFPDETRFFQEQGKAFARSYLPSVEWKNVIEVGGNRIYKASDDVKRHFAARTAENEVAAARYLAATLWTTTIGMGLTSGVWSVMQGFTCLVPNEQLLVKLLGKKGTIKAIQFGSYAGLSTGYSMMTSGWFFGMRNFTMHRMDLYTEKEIAAEIPFKELVTSEEIPSLSDLGIEPEDKIGLSETVSVIDGDYDEEIPLELDWLPTAPEGEVEPAPPEWADPSGGTPQ